MSFINSSKFTSKSWNFMINLFSLKSFCLWFDSLSLFLYVVAYLISSLKKKNPSDCSWSRWHCASRKKFRLLYLDKLSATNCLKPTINVDYHNDVLNVSIRKAVDYYLFGCNVFVISYKPVFGLWMTDFLIDSHNCAAQ